MRTLSVTAAIFAVLTVVVRAQEPGADADREARVAWLKEHAIALRSIDPADEDFSDLEPLRKAINEARIVQLGEQSHGDGATFHAKARLIKFLHQKMGFDVLAFESGLYDCRKAWELLRAGTAPYEAFQHGVFGIWTASEQVQPVIDYLGKTVKSDRPLELCGFDCQFTGQASATHLQSDVKALLKRLDPGVIDAPTEAALFEALAALPTRAKAADRAASEKRIQAVAELGRVLAAAQPSEELSKNELSFWRQYAASLAVEATRAEAGGEPMDIEVQKKSGSQRDEQMAKNLIWLAREAYPDRKIIVWAASFHLMRNPASIQQSGNIPADYYRDIVTMGDGVWKELADTTYTLAFVAAEGEAGRFSMPRLKLPPPARGSLEDLLVAAGQSNAIVDFRRLDEGGAWLRQKLPARPLGYSNMVADWTNVFDGIVFTRTMTPSTLAGRSSPPAAARDRFALGWTGPPQKKTGDFESGLDTKVKHGGNASAYIKATTDRPRGGTTLVQAFAADSYRGKRVRMSAYVRTRDVGSIGLWMRVDTDESGNVAFDNMGTRPIKGTNDWTKHEIVLDVPADAVDVTFGVIASGGGQAWFDDFQFEAVGNEVATTAMRAPIMKRKSKMGSNLAKGPMNLDFEG